MPSRIGIITSWWMTAPGFFVFFVHLRAPSNSDNDPEIGQDSKPLVRPAPSSGQHRHFVVFDQAEVDLCAQAWIV